MEDMPRDQLTAPDPFGSPGPVQWLVHYEVSSLVGDAVVGSGTVETCAAEPAAAATQAVAWVHEHDVCADPRLDPVVRIVGVEEIDALERR